MTTSGPPSPVPPVPAAPGAPRRGRTSGLDKILIGCGLGCVGLAVLAVLAVVGAGIWAFRPGEQHETAVVLSEDTAAAVRLRDPAEDPGAQAFLLHALREIDRVNRRSNRESLPEELRWLADLSRQDASPEGLNILLPREVTIALEPAPGALGDDPGYGVVGSVNFRSFVRPIRWIFENAVEEAGGEVRDVDGHRMIEMSPTLWLAFVDGTLYFAETRDRLQLAVERSAADAAPVGLPVPVPEGTWDLDGAARGPAAARFAAELAGLGSDSGADEGLEDPEAEEPVAAGESTATPLEAPPGAAPGGRSEAWRRVETAAFGVDLVSADGIRFRARFESDAPDGAAAWAAELTREWDARRDRLADEGIDLEHRIEADGRVVEAEADFAGLEVWLSTAIERLLVPPMDEDPPAPAAEPPG